ncbi:hypothetical protein ACNTMW_00130 [Planosporangium sp. 12N6]|uniref:hypothetical protein n=1 Tax=Planosporangium spinosum TaxID=3402278 RepID=UPI003CE78CB0
MRSVRVRALCALAAGAEAAELAERIRTRPPEPVRDLGSGDLAELDHLVTKLPGAG